MIASYRDPRYAASIRLEQLRERFHGRAENIPAEMTQVYARRTARSWAGGVAVAGFAAMVVATAERAFNEETWDAKIGVHPTTMLLAAVVLSLATYVVARLVAPRSFPRRVWASFDQSEDELTRVARFEGDDIQVAAARIVDAREKWSLGLPIAGIALLAPLSSHLVIWALVGGELASSRWLDKFDTWIGLSLVLVGLAHVALAVLGLYFARKVRDASFSQLSAASPVGGWAALGITVAVSLVPGVIALAIPPILVLITGLPIVPGLFRHMYRTALEERRALGLS